MTDRSQRVKNIVSRIDELASISEDGSGITRRYGTAAAVEAGKKVLGWMLEAGLTARVDAMGNVRGVWKGDGVAGAPVKTLVIASHIDTVVNAGRWDGPLGVVMGLDLVENMVRNGIRLPFDIELIAFCDEEGVRFHTTFLGSKVVAGSFEPEMLERRDENGVSLLEAMGGDVLRPGEMVARLKEEAIDPGRWLGYFEIHIEQGPVLYERKIPVAPVKAIAGQVRAEVIFKGMAGHAGTVPMEMRQDALCGAAEFVLEVEKLAGEAVTGLVATVGKLRVKGSASNVIPGEVICSLDIRCAAEDVVSKGHEQLRALCLEIALRRGLVVDWKVVQVSSPVSCDARMKDLLSSCVRAEGYEVLELVSGAGHDAVPVSAVSPVCMLFVRCFKGISHNPLEDVEEKDLGAALAVAEKFIQSIV